MAKRRPMWHPGRRLRRPRRRVRSRSSRQRTRPSHELVVRWRWSEPRRPSNAPDWRERSELPADVNSGEEWEKNTLVFVNKSFVFFIVLLLKVGFWQKETLWLEMRRRCIWFFLMASHFTLWEMKFWNSSDRSGSAVNLKTFYNEPQGPGFAFVVLLKDAEWIPRSSVPKSMERVAAGGFYTPNKPRRGNLRTIAMLHMNMTTNRPPLTTPADYN